MKKSIGRKINMLIAVSLIVLSVFMIGVNAFLIYSNTSRDSEIMMKKACDSQALQLNGQLRFVEQSVQNIYLISENIRPSVKALSDENVANTFIDRIRDMAISIAENTEGAMALYYRMNPDVTMSGTTGFFYVKTLETGQFESTEITNLYDYDVNDVEHVGWYYIPVWAGRPVWMEPYYNANLGVEMISYVVPIYDGNTVVGVVGIDVDFSVIEDIAESIDIYKSSGAVLCSMNSSKIYYNKKTIWGEVVPNDIYTLLQGNECSDKMISYKVNGERYGLYFQTLHNRMKILVYAKMDEIYSHGFYSIMISLVIFGVVFFVTLLMSIHMGKKIVQPISNITEASQKYAQGEWDVKVYCDTEDELQILTENISIMADKTKEYISYINDMAKKDGLTGLRNKTDYMLYVEKINHDYEKMAKNYAIVVFDVNNLKTVNDNFGHEKGDELLVSASRFICKSFSHSPVFRIGGDEFVSIVDSADYEKRDEILSDFRHYMSLSKNSTDIMEICVACGMATYGEDGTIYEELFQIADQRMYENKQQLKDGLKPR